MTVKIFQATPSSGFSSKPLLNNYDNNNLRGVPAPETSNQLTSLMTGSDLKLPGSFRNIQFFTDN